MSSDCPAYPLKNTAMKAFLLVHFQNKEREQGGGNSNPKTTSSEQPLKTSHINLQGAVVQILFISLKTFQHRQPTEEITYTMRQRPCSPFIQLPKYQKHDKKTPQRANPGTGEVTLLQFF